MLSPEKLDLFDLIPKPDATNMEDVESGGEQAVAAVFFFIPFLPFFIVKGIIVSC